MTEGSNENWNLTQIQSKSQEFSSEEKKQDTKWKVNIILDWNKARIDEYIKFREKTTAFYGEILQNLIHNTDSRTFHKWHAENISTLQNIYRKKFPNYTKFIAWYCLIWATPKYEEIEYCDFPWKYNLINFLLKFKIEIDNMKDEK